MTNENKTNSTKVDLITNKYFEDSFKTAERECRNSIPKNAPLPVAMLERV